MSATPRTEAALTREAMESPDSMIVLDTARALERELAAAKRTLSAVHASLCNIHDRCIDNVDVDEESGTGDRTPNLEGHIVIECDEAIAAIERVIGKRP